MQRAMLGSLGGHVVLFSLLLVGPLSSPTEIPIPPVMTVRLMAAIPAPPEARPAPAPVARPKPKLKILPKHAPAATAKPRKKPPPEVVKRKPRPKEQSYEDAMASLREGDEFESLLQAPKAAAPSAAVASSATSEGTSSPSRCAERFVSIGKCPMTFAASEARCSRSTWGRRDSC
jgi:outer membrane biosynthesis protein TonB